MVRFIYVCLLRLHPRQFRQRFADEMLWIFDEAMDSRGRLVTDAVVSLWRQCALRPHTGHPAASAPAPQAFDGVPAFYTCESFMPRRSALINGGVLSVGIFLGLYLTMAHWTSHASSTLLIGSHHHGRSHLLEVQSPTVAPTDLNTEIKVKPERGRPKDVWSQMLSLLSSSPLPSQSQDQRMDQIQAAVGRKRVVRGAASGNSGPKTGMKWQAGSEKPPGLWTSLRLFVSTYAAPLSRHPVPLVRARGGHPPVAATSSPQPEEYEEWDDPRGGFPAMYFRVILVLGALDADHDGIISSSEIANASAALRSLDLNHDGKLTPDECGQGPGDASIRGDVAEHARIEFMHFNPVLAALDADHNGEISAREIQNAPTALNALDKNDDGKLTQDEVLPDPMANAVGFVMRLDANGDRKISKNERSGELARRYQELLDAADQDKDGVVTEGELITEIQRRAALTGIVRK